MKLINEASTTLNDIVEPIQTKGCSQCLDACKCIDCDPHPVP